jgi:hypothetical protein
MTFGEDWGAAKGRGHEVYETYREAGGKLRLHGFGTGRFRCYRYSERGRVFVYRTISQAWTSTSVEQVEALDEASSIEPVKTRNKTMTRALTYGGMRDGVVA